MSFVPSYELKGIRASVEALDKARAMLIFALNGGVYQLAKDILARSQKYVPVETGELKESGEVDARPEGMLEKNRWESIYAINYNAPHAVYVHEQLDYHHEPPTCAKFLERAVTEVVAEQGRRILFDVTSGLGVTGLGLTRVNDLGEIV